MNGMKTGHEGSSARGANGVDVIVAEDNSAVSQGVEVGSGHLIGPVKSNIIPTLKKWFLSSKENNFDF
jgi:hypothetical protein